MDGQRIVVRSGGCAFAPRRTTHRFQNLDGAAAEILVWVTRGGFDQLFEELSLFCKQPYVRIRAGIERIVKKYGIEVLGTPLP
jgi:hypothetical protein